ncbi:hypothetical protein OG897_24595 [Streptomyces sp. NBC_00237]|uniref:hypothetical protein n=1 Tax=Streptomyces sp. NBC_00237 TaxID=2975687 RepID=UPI002251B359|nr:hypothetical protein [Streptomyces sp. NBC_00237]MCX5204622.1 hypothetical protein [Streptomyces sp. NBC_00237]
MARHAASKPPRRSLLRAGLTVTAVGAALTAGAGAAQAAPSAPSAGVGQEFGEFGTSPGEALTGALTHSAAGGLGPAKNIRLDPLAGTDVDPLNNTVGTQVADFKPVTTGAATGALAKGGGLKDLPVVGAVASVLPG